MNDYMKLHLGCGENYLNGYHNIDYPSDNHTVQKNAVADQFCDIRNLSFTDNSIEEIRLHHLFEHFPRQVALALLCKWTKWLKTGCILHIETPDFDRSIIAYLLPWTSYDEKEQIIRHLFGSHEASWAAHWDGWHEKRFLKILSKLGYEDIKFSRKRWGATRNIEVVAVKGMSNFKNDDLCEISREILKDSLIKNNLLDIPASEMAMLDLWMNEWKNTFAT